MADRFYTSIYIGGHIGQDVMPDFLGTLRMENLENNQSETSDLMNEFDLGLFITESGKLRFVNPEQAGGIFEDLEVFCVGNNIAFDRYTDGKYEFGSEVVKNRPGMEVFQCETDSRGSPVVSSRELLERFEDFLLHKPSSPNEKTIGMEEEASAFELREYLQSTLGLFIPELERFSSAKFPANPDIPELTFKGLQAYATEFVPTGGFLRAVLENNLLEAVTRSDRENREALVHIVKYVYNELPRECHGSKEAVEAWLKKRGKE